MQLPKLLNSKFDTQHLSLPFFCNTTGTWFWRCVQPEGKWQLLGVYYLFIMSAPPPPRFEDRKACHHEEGGAARTTCTLRCTTYESYTSSAHRLPDDVASRKQQATLDRVASRQSPAQGPIFDSPALPSKRHRTHRIRRIANQSHHHRKGE